MLNEIDIQQTELNEELDQLILKIENVILQYSKSSQTDDPEHAETTVEQDVASLNISPNILSDAA